VIYVKGTKMKMCRPPGYSICYTFPTKNEKKFQWISLKDYPYPTEKKILVVIDRLTSYAHFIGVRKTDSTKKTAEIFCKNIYKLHGFPKVIVSDRDAKFKGNFWREFCK
jgi:hypothetical protein